MSYNPKTNYSKLPTRHKDLQDRINDAYQRGSDDTTKQFREHMDRLEKKHKEDFNNRRRDIRIEALKQITSLASAYGQLMYTITEAMKSEADQL